MEKENSLVIFTRASQMLAEADSIQKAKELKSLALTAADWARRKGMGEEAIKHCRSYALEAERKMGEMLAATERQKPGQYQRLHDDTVAPTLSDLGLTKRESAEAQMLASLPDEKVDLVKAGELTRSAAIREIKRNDLIERLENIKTKEAKRVEGVFDVIVIDPPWPMEKIERDVRPNQSEMDYPTMTEGKIHSLEIPHAKDCHIWIWTTHRFLPSVFKMIHFRRLSYVCTFVWHKPGGFQPIDLPQYNCEFAVYCRYGKPKFIDTKAFPVCFKAPRGSHSEKPEEFYSMIRKVTAGRRLDMFSRRAIEGFEGWGNQAQ